MYLTGGILVTRLNLKLDLDLANGFRIRRKHEEKFGFYFVNVRLTFMTISCVDFVTYFQKKRMISINSFYLFSQV